MSKIRVVIDTNLWVSALISVKVRLNNLILNPDLEIVVSEALLLELEEVLRREKFRRYFSIEEVEIFLFNLQAVAISIQVTSNLYLCDDPKDNFLLNLAIDSNANFLLSGDKDLLRMATIQQTKILTLTEFFPIINQSNG